MPNISRYQKDLPCIGFAPCRRTRCARRLPTDIGSQQASLFDSQCAA